MFNKTAIFWSVLESPLRVAAEKDGLTEIFSKELFERGWGNGYVHVHRDVLGDFDTLIGNEQQFCPAAEITYEDWQGDYYVFGFDTNHAWDNFDKWPKAAVMRAAHEAYENVCRYFEVKYTDSKARCVLALKDELDVIRNMAKRRTIGTAGYFLKNSEKYLLKSE